MSRQKHAPRAGHRHLITDAADRLDLAPVSLNPTLSSRATKRVHGLFVADLQSRAKRLHERYRPSAQASRQSGSSPRGA